MDEQAPKKRGRKPLPPEERSKRGRKRIVHQEIQERKQQGAPPLQISFVCNEEPCSAPISASLLNPFTDNVGSTSTEVNVKRPVIPDRRKTIITALNESDDDEIPSVAAIPRVDVSHLSGQKCIELLGAHTDRRIWPSRTEFCCWNCTYPFDTIPLSIPGALHKRLSVMTGCYGVFCSFNCARRYCMNRNRHDSMQQLQLLSYLYKQILGANVRVTPAGPFQTLKKFGGYMDIDEYRKNFISLPPKDAMFDPNVRRDYVSMLTEKQVPYFHTVVHTHNQQLRTDSIQERNARNKMYERTTPLPGSQDLATSMGITS